MLKIMVLSLLAAGVSASAWAQASIDNHQVKSINGTVVNVDSVGNVITIKTADQQQMAFAVPETASIMQQTHAIGLMDIRATDPVTIQYISSSGKYTVVSLVDNKSATSP